MKRFVFISSLIVVVAFFVGGCGEKLNTSTDKVIHEGVLSDARYLQQSSWGSSPRWQLSFEDGFTIEIIDDDEIFSYEEGFVLGRDYRIYQGHIYDKSYVYATQKGRAVLIKSW